MSTKAAHQIRRYDRRKCAEVKRSGQGASIGQIIFQLRLSLFFLVCRGLPNECRKYKLSIQFGSDTPRPTWCFKQTLSHMDHQLTYDQHICLLKRFFSSLCTAMDENVKVISVASIYCEKESEQRLKSICGGCGAAEMWSGEGRRTSKAAEGDEPTCDGYCWG